MPSDETATDNFTRQLVTAEDGGVVIEYGIVIATIVLLLVTVGDTMVQGVADFFAGIPALFPTP